jgi:murein DD-endopeptidase MepM/ murein hydrolase activator NlpD
MRHILLAVTVVFVTFVFIHNRLDLREQKDSATVKKDKREISGTVNKGETFIDIFKKYGLDMRELFQLREASAAVHRLRNLYPGQAYRIIVDDNNQVESLVYWIDADNILHITRGETGFEAQKVPIEYEKRVQHIGGLIKDNLISSIGEESERVKVALQLSDIFAWDIDFASDLREGDSFRIILEGHYLNGEFRRFGDILAAEFVNNGETYRAYRFGQKEKFDYYDDQGKALKKVFLKAPLSFRQISSHFSRNRFHPVLKIYRPHRGLDYTAPAGTPVSAVGEGTVLFAGHKGQYGKLVALRHANGWTTYYGHLSKFAKNVRRGKRVEQGQVIGYVGSSGMSTGPHLHYELRIGKKPVNPLSVKMPRGEPVPENLLMAFNVFKNQMDVQFASIPPPFLAQAGKEKKKKI